MKKLSRTKFIILGLLTIEPLSGYGIKKLINNSTSHFWAESNGQIYPALKKLLKENFINLLEKKANGKKYSNIYEISKQGKIELKKWLKNGSVKNIYRDEGLLKLFFGKNSSIDESIKHIKKRREKTIENLDSYSLIMNEIKHEKHSPHHIYWLITLKNGLCMAQAKLKWCDESIKMLEEHKKCQY